MANKLYAMEQLTEEVAKDIAAKPEEWMRFLDTASRLYKYTFDEQLLIFAQRPEATAVASMEVWNKRMYRWIKKGSKGIALIDYTSGPKNRLRYVFDISDTYKVRNLGKDPALWVLPQDDRSFAADYLQRAYGLDEGDGGLAGTLYRAAQESVREWLPDAFDELKQDVQGTFLEELDEQNQEVEFRDLMTDSVWYVLLKRCGMDTEAYLSADSLRHITDFNDLRVLGHLGTAVNEICRPILMQLGRYVLMGLENDRKTVAKESEVVYNEFNTLIRESEEITTETEIEENKEETEHERDHLQQERGLSDPGYQTGGDQGNHREIRDNAEHLIEQYDIRSSQGPVTKARSMSGGNQQKAIIAREIDKNPELLVAVQPTRGLDVGAIENVHKELVAQRDAGKGVLLISLELDEVMNVSDRILVMYEGEIVGEFDPKHVTVEELGLYMAGSKRKEA